MRDKTGHPIGESPLRGYLVPQSFGISVDQLEHRCTGVVDGSRSLGALGVLHHLSDMVRDRPERVEALIGSNEY